MDSVKKGTSSRRWKYAAGRASDINSDLAPVWMEGVALEEFRLVHGRLPEINAEVAEVASFEAELGPAPVDTRDSGPVS